MVKLNITLNDEEQAAWERTWKDMSGQIHKKLTELNLSSVDDVEEFLG